ncbi:MFS transporter [Paraburkholderia solisilvae]|uniref:Niacin/nicotinamide transporter NaiP n=1 Tax=Paraburkholderia solisilvae TaxID=624376 RepID=A0A6J5CYF8_9BURK|nr:MFS transporter [Paraburkholderia solisilvae]CAB3746167.1 Putative niacin/nicotinamide transporter NaiP [Paraburkholderia solisilvae]
MVHLRSRGQGTAASDGHAVNAPAPDDNDSSLAAFYRQMAPRERRTFWTCFSGWGLDALDFMIYPLVIGTITVMWQVEPGMAGLAVTVTLLTSAIGGWLAGYLADRIGRVRTLQITVGWFCLFSLVCAVTRNFDQLMIARGLLGFGFGGEWAAGAVLIGETVRPAYRGRAVGSVQSAWGVGWGAAVLLQAITFSLLPPHLAWRAMFAAGAVPAVMLIYARRYVHEPRIAEHALGAGSHHAQAPSLWEIFSGPRLRTTLLGALFVMGCQGGYYAISTWIPTFLKTERHLSVINSTGYLGFLIAGSIAGYLTGAWISDRFGRKTLFVSFSVIAIVAVLAYTQLTIGNDVMLWLGFPLGFFGSGYLAGVGPFLTELYPTRLRGSGQGFCYNFGRGMGALFPTLVGLFAKHLGLASAIAIFAVFAYALMLASVALLPETRGIALEDI